MHPYATDSEERAQIPLWIAGAAIGLAWVVSLIVGTTHLPFWVEVPGTGALYGGLYGLFKQWGWRQKLFQRLHVVRVPDLRGDWHGTVSSSFDQNAETHAVKVKIAQNWTHIFITLSSNLSDSKSLVASVETRDDVVLSYQYWNTPKPHAAATLHAHRGTAVLKLSANGKHLSGEYYSGRDRLNYGALELTKGKHD